MFVEVKIRIPNELYEQVALYGRLYNEPNARIVIAYALSDWMERIGESRIEDKIRLALAPRACQSWGQGVKSPGEPTRLTKEIQHGSDPKSKVGPSPVRAANHRPSASSH